MRIALLAPDNRENFRKYDLPEPCFGTAPTALLEGFAMLAESSDAPEIHVISCTQRRITAPEKLASNIWFHSLHVPKAGWLRSGYLGCAMAIGKKLRQIRPDLVHAQGTERDCAICAVMSPYPKILTIHGNLRLIRSQIGFRSFSAMWIQSYLEGFVVPRFDGVICITNYTREAVEHEVPKTWVVPNAVDPSFLALGEKRLSDASARPSTLDSRLTTPIILVVANIDARKNQNDFIRAMDSLVSQVPFEVRFFGSCGVDDYGRKFRQLIAERPWCRYGGNIGREELRNQFAEADLLVLPTREDNCPMVVLEAMAAGVPVIASQVGGIPDLIDGTTTGFFCDPTSPESMRSEVGRLLLERDTALRLAEAARREALSRFHPAVVARRHLEVYRDVLNR